jgi:hypothetical protein
MTKHYLTSIFLLIASFAYSQADTTEAQIDTTINLNLLRAPASPASNLLGISPNEIQRPTDVKAFMLSVQNASQGFSSVPSSFGVDIAPYWFARKKYTFTEQTSRSKKILQSLVVSFAVRNYQSKSKVDSTTQVGVGLKFSLLRGVYEIEGIRKLAKNISNFSLALDAKEAKDESYKKLIKERDTLANQLADEIRTNGDNTPKAINLKRQIDKQELALSDRVKVLIDAVLKESEEIKTFIEKQRIVRIGWKLDIAGGAAWDFSETKFNNGKVFKAGIWLTGGWESKSGHAFLGILRYLNNPDKVFADDKGVLKGKTVNTYDYGFRYNFQASGSPFAINAELIYRGVAAKEIDNSYRVVLNANYEVSKNTILTLSLGRDFDKTFKKDGNVIAFLNFVKGFGF